MATTTNNAASGYFVPDGIKLSVVVVKEGRMVQAL